MRNQIRLMQWIFLSIVLACSAHVEAGDLNALPRIESGIDTLIVVSGLDTQEIIMQKKGEGIQEKRVGPTPVEPISHNGIRYEALQWGRQRGLDQNGGYIAAIDEETGAELWILKVYQVSYDNDLEGDVQDVFITKLSMTDAPNGLIVDNEDGLRYRVDLVTRAVERIP